MRPSFLAMYGEMREATIVSLRLENVIVNSW